MVRGDDEHQGSNDSGVAGGIASIVAGLFGK